MGSLQTGRRVAAKIAFAIAGAMGGTLASPAPPGASLLRTMCTSTLRHFAHAQHVVGIEIPLLSASPVDGDGALKCRRETISNPAFYLLLEDGRIHHLAAIDGAHHAMHFHLAAFEGDLCNLCGETAQVVYQCNALVTARCGLAPVSLFCNQVEYREHSRRVAPAGAGALLRDLFRRPLPVRSRKHSAKKVFCE